MKTFLKTFFKIKLSGYMLAMTTVMLSMIVIISGSISFILMREINRINIPISSQIAYNYADTAMRCLDTINAITVNNYNAGLGVFDFATTTFVNRTGFQTNSLTCMGSRLFESNLLNPEASFSLRDIKNSNSDSSISKVNSPATFYGGYKYEKKVIINGNVDGVVYDGCVNIEVYSTSTSLGIPHKLFITKGQVPCERGVERVISKSY